MSTIVHGEPVNGGGRFRGKIRCPQTDTPMKLTDTAIRTAKAIAKPWKLFDGRGLFLLVNPDGSRWWRYKYRFGGKERLLALGTYPEVKLKEAREAHERARKQLRDGIDPSAARKAEKATRVDRHAGTFEVVAREWHATKSEAWADKGEQRILRRLELYVFPRIGGKQIHDLTGPDLLDVLRRIEAKGHAETAHRVRQCLGQIFRYAVATHRATHDPSAALRGALAPRPNDNFASITDPKKVGGLIRAIRGYAGSDVVRCALQLLPLTFVRPGELRGARWEEFTFDLVDAERGSEDPQWRIPAERMKMREQHIVPLSRQAIAILRELHGFTGPDGFLFPNERSTSRSISENTINAGLRGLGYASDQMTGHGFRHMASTILHERGYRSEWIERQLAHGDRNTMRARYNFAEHLPERRRMMQEWADYLDGLARGADVVPIGSAKRS
jgi:integrase